ncbi:WD40 repeat domain-containing protein [Herbidospora mongoliensis]|uniref:WD40 repeat domain-containing protein n=1 Tax=Herbidospora mongoliensis TaxID=688067 RepID=UPI000AC4245D|nr:hypothetical protein [Herbidospora mongoliensis]
MAGKPSYRELAKQTGMSHTSARTVILCERLPRWGALELIVESLGGATEEFHRLWLAADAVAAPAVRVSGESVTAGATEFPTPHHEISGAGSPAVGEPEIFRAESPPTAARTPAATGQDISGAESPSAAAPAQQAPLDGEQEAASPQPRLPGFPLSRRAVLISLSSVAAVAAAGVVLASRLLGGGPATRQGVLFGGPLSGGNGAVWSVAHGVLKGRPVILYGCQNGTVHLRDFVTGERIGAVLTGHSRAVFAARIANVGGQATGVTGAADGTVRMWDLASGQGRALNAGKETGGINALATATIRDRPHAFTAGDDLTIRRWDLAASSPAGEVVGQPLAMSPKAIAVGDVDGKLTALSGGDDRLVRRWDLTAPTPAGVPIGGHDGTIWNLTMGRRDNRAIALSASEDGTNRLWDLSEPQPIGHPLGDRLPNPVKCVALAVVGGTTIGFSGADDGTLREWDLTTSTQIGAPLEGPNTGPEAMETATLNGRTYLFAGTWDGYVWRFDLGPTA